MRPLTLISTVSLACTALALTTTNALGTATFAEVEQQSIITQESLKFDTLDMDRDVLVQASADSEQALVYRLIEGKLQIETGLLAPNIQPGDDWDFGAEVRVSDEWIAIAAPNRPKINGNGEGKVYMYHFDGMSWNLIQSYTGLVENAHLGGDGALALTEDTLAIGGADGRLNFYYLDVNASTWKSSGSMLNVDTSNLHVSGDWAICDGGAFHFNGSWIQAQNSPVLTGSPVSFDGEYLASSDGMIYKRTGNSWDTGFNLGVTGKIEIYGKHAAVLDADWSPNHAPNNEAVGQVSLFTRQGNDNIWVKSDEHRSSYDQEGVIADDHAITDEYIVSYGKGHLSLWDIGNQNEAASLVPSQLLNPSPEPHEHFGWSVATNGKYSIVGTPFSKWIGPNSAQPAGSMVPQGTVAVYKRSYNDLWGMPQELESQGITECFGWSTDMLDSDADRGTTIAVGAPGNPWGWDMTGGKVFVLSPQIASSNWNHVELVPEVLQPIVQTEPDSHERYGDSFGYDVSIAQGTNNVVVVGAPEMSGWGYKHGAIYIFAEIEGTWTHVSIQGNPSAVEEGYFGSDVEISRADGNLHIRVLEPGASQLHKYTGSLDGLNWSHDGVEMVISPGFKFSADSSSDDSDVLFHQFGSSLAITNVVGNQHYVALGDANFDNLTLARVMPYSLTNSHTAETVALSIPDNLSGNSSYGHDVDLAMHSDELSVIVGAPYALFEGPQGQSGAVWIHEKQMSMFTNVNIHLFISLIDSMAKRERFDRDSSESMQLDLNHDQQIDELDLIVAIEHFEPTDHANQAERQETPARRDAAGSTRERPSRRGDQGSRRRR